MGYSARIVADSVSRFEGFTSGDRLTTMVVTFPRMVLAEFNTHRMFSRNSASSRAIPVERQLARVLEDPFVPVHFGANQAGMQAGAELEGDQLAAAKAEWLHARDSAVRHVQHLLDYGLHKQVTNRILEPFMWHTVVVTATEWSNFFALRCHPDAQPEIRVVAEMMRGLYEVNEPEPVEVGQWHLPFIQDEERDGAFELSEEARKISAARCARVSYLTHEGQRDLEADLRLYDRLVSGGHLSPLEHVATPNEPQYRSMSNFRGWWQLRKTLPNEWDFSLATAEAAS